MTMAIRTPAVAQTRPTGPLPPRASTRQKRPSTQILAALGAVLPLGLLSLWMYVLRDTPPTLGMMLLGPLIGGGGLTLWILFLHLRVCGDSLDSLGVRAGRPWLDLALGALVGIALLVFQLFVWNGVAGGLFAPRPPAPEVVELLSGVARNPWLLALWLGPVVWIGVALFEELMRAFVLRRLWQVWHGPAGRWGAVLLVSALIGLAHGYQGPSAATSIGLQSILLGWFFMATGRLRALIVAHAFYDSVQVALGVIMIRQLQP